VASKNKLFRAIVLMGAAMTAQGCDDAKCAKCAPTDAVASQDVNTSQTGDAGVGDGQTDAFIAIL
jgi:hypothetical protein